MPIPLTKKVTKKAAKSISYDSVFVKRMQIMGQDVDSHSARATLLPYNATTGDIADPSEAILVQLGNVQELASKNPKVATAFAALLDAIEDVAKEQGKI